MVLELNQYIKSSKGLGQFMIFLERVIICYILFVYVWLLVKWNRVEVEMYDRSFIMTIIAKLLVWF